MEIKQALIEHLTKVYNLICELENEKIDKDKFTKIYLENINNDNIFYLIAADKEEVIGFSSVHIQNLLHHCAKVAEVQELIVSKDYQGLGVGGLLFDEMKKLASLNNCTEFEVCCNLKREKSHKFYLKKGLKKSHYKFTSL